MMMMMMMMPHGLHRRPSCSLWLVDSAASLSAVDVKRSRRLGLTWPPSGAHLLTPPLASSRLFVYFQKVSAPPVPCCSLYVGLLRLLIWVFSSLKTMTMMNLFCSCFLDAHCCFIKAIFFALRFRGLCSRCRLNLIFAAKMLFGTKILKTYFFNRLRQRREHWTL